MLELPKLEKTEESDEPKLISWGKFLSATSDRELEELAMKDPDMEKAKTALDRLSRDPEARVLAEMRERARISYQLDLGKAHEEGLEKGIKRGEASLLITQLSTRFGELPPGIAERVGQASEAELTEWAKRVLTADTLGAVFADS